MNHRLVQILCASALGFAFALTSTVATAGDLKAKVGKIFEELDANDDGVITKAESGSSWLTEKFDKIDADKDAKLTFDEVLAFKKAHHKKDGDCKRPPDRA